MTLPKNGSTLGDLVEKVRSKNAGPFWLTVDIFCGDADRFAQVANCLDEACIARVFGADTELVKRFTLADLNVVKFSLPRPTVQGAAADRDMHGASWAALIAEVEI